MKTIRLQGIAASWRKFRPHNAIFRKRFITGAFQQWIASGEAIDTPICLQHNTDLALSIHGGTHFTETRDGLRVSFYVRPGVDELTDNVLFALRHGFFNGFSLGYRELRTLTGHSDNIGNFSLIAEACFGELSIVDQPLIPRTSIDFSTWQRPAKPTKPKSIADRRRLSDFLASIDYEHPKPKPKPKTKPKVEIPVVRLPDPPVCNRIKIVDPNRQPTIAEMEQSKQRLVALQNQPRFMRGITR